MKNYILHESGRTTYECPLCSAVVRDIRKHSEFHDSVAFIGRAAYSGAAVNQPLASGN